MATVSVQDAAAGFAGIVMSLRPSRRGLVPPFIAMDVLRAANERAAAGGDVIHLELGEPGSPAPQKVRDAAREALEGAPIGYTDALGLGSLRQAIAAHYEERYGVVVEPAQIAVTTGSSAAFLLAFLAAFEVGDRVGLAFPGYPAYRNILTALGLEPVPIMVGSESHYQPTPEIIADLLPLAGLVIASPANPTGTMIGASDLTRLTGFCGEQQIRLISDEIYHGITYETAAETVGAFAPEAIVVNSFSKYYCMTGWRLGWMLLPPDLIRSVECLAQNFYVSPPALSQRAAVAAFACRDELDGHVARYRRNRDILIEALAAVGISRFAPANGAFYLYADISEAGIDSEDFCRRLLAETEVALTPGRDFDPVRGGSWVRLSYAGSTDDVAAAACRLGAWLKRG